MEQKGFHYCKLSFLTHFIDHYLWLGCRRSLCLWRHSCRLVWFQR